MTAQRFIGSEHGVNVSFFVNHSPPGHVTGPHRHPYPEVFVVHDGEATFTVDGAERAARGGEIVVVPARAVHGFANGGETTLEMVSIHPVADMDTEWLS